MNAAAYLLATGEAGATALECGAERLNYGELRAAVGRAAGAWRVRGLEQGERVLVFAPDSIAWIIAYLGTIWAGAPSAATPPAGILFHEFLPGGSCCRHA